MELDKDLVSDLDITKLNNAVELVLKEKKPSVILKVILVFIIAFSSLIAALMLVAAIVSGNFRIHVLVIVGVIGGSVYFLYRLLLWNLYGREILTIESSKVTYVADYGRFKDNYIEFERENLAVELVARNVKTMEYRKITLSNGTKSVTLVTEKKEEVMNKVKGLILSTSL